MPRNVNLKIVTVITALTVAIIALSITSENQLFAKKHKNANSDSGSTDNNQNEQMINLQHQVEGVGRITKLQ